MLGTRDLKRNVKYALDRNPGILHKVSVQASYTLLTEQILDY